MDRVTAWKTLGDMWSEASPEQREALTVAMNDIEFVDLAADDMAYVVRCKDCKHFHKFETYSDCINGYGIDYCKPNDFCSYGQRREATP